MPKPPLEYKRALDRFKVWQLVLAVVHLASGFTIVAYCAYYDIKEDESNKSWPINLSVDYSVWIAPKDRSCGDTDAGCTIFKLQKHFAKFDLGYAAGCFSIISGLHHLLVCLALWNPKTKLGEFYGRCYKTSIFPWRWLDYAVTSGLMLSVTGGLFESPAPLDFILFCFCFQFVVVVAGAASECAWSATTSKEGVDLLDNGRQKDIEDEYQAALTQKSIWPAYYPYRLDQNSAYGIAIYTFNCFAYLLFYSWVSALSLAANIVISVYLSAVKFFEVLFNRNFKGARNFVKIQTCDFMKIRLLTYRQNRTMWSTTSGLIFSSTFAVYALIQALFIYKFYLGMSIEDPSDIKKYNEDSCGNPIPRGISKPSDAIWIAILSITATFTSFAVCHINKISLAKASNVLDTIKYETIYGFLSFTSKLILLYNIFAGIVMRSESGITPADYNNPVNITEFENPTAKKETDDGPSASLISLYSVVPVCILLGIASYYDIVISQRTSKEDPTPPREKPANAGSVALNAISKLIF